MQGMVCSFVFGKSWSNKVICCLMFLSDLCILFQFPFIGMGSMISSVVIALQLVAPDISLFDKLLRYSSAMI